MSTDNSFKNNRRLIVATKNKGKLKEFKELLCDLPYEVLSQEEAGFNEDIDETGLTFEENAFIKAMAIHNKTNDMVVADDSGLEVDCLNGEPGIHSARYAGDGATDDDRNTKLLKMLENIDCKSRTARFVCSIVVIQKDGKHFSVRGECEGIIGTKPKGDNGFGYDPLFFLPQFNKTMAELDSMKKNEISHRGKALKLVRDKLLKQT